MLEVNHVKIKYFKKSGIKVEFFCMKKALKTELLCFFENHLKILGFSHKPCERSGILAISLFKY